MTKSNFLTFKAQVHLYNSLLHDEKGAGDSAHQALYPFLLPSVIAQPLQVPPLRRAASREKQAFQQ